MKKRFMVFLLLSSFTLLLASCSRPAQNHENQDDADISEEQNRNHTEDGREEKEEGTGSELLLAEKAFVQNKKYGISLPSPEQFGQELKDLIYWECATDIYQEDSPNYGCVLYSTLEQDHLLGKDVTLQLLYREEKAKDYDYLESNFYSVIVCVPRNGKKDMVGETDMFELRYNTRGIQSGIDYFEWDDDYKRDMYTEYGEITLRLSKEEMQNYKIPELKSHEEKEKSAIINKIEKAILNYGIYGCDIYIHDFRLSDAAYSGCIIFHDKGGKVFLPYGWIHGGIYYTGEKMDKKVYVSFEYRYTTAFNGGGYSRETAIDMAKEQEESISLDKCLLAYKVKKDRLVPLKK